MGFPQRYSINCARPTLGTSIKSRHIDIDPTFIQKNKLFRGIPGHILFPCFAFFLHIEDAPVRWHKEISFYDDTDIVTTAAFIGDKPTTVSERYAHIIDSAKIRAGDTLSSVIFGDGNK